MELQEKSVHVGHHPLRSTSDGLPNLVGATCVAPAMRTSMHGIPPCSISKSSLHEQPYQIRSSAMQADATVFICRFLRFRMLKILQSFSTFSTFSTFQHCDRSRSILTFFSIGHRSSLAMPHPIDRCHYSQVIYSSLSPYITVA